jgi:hypothetical protein
MEPQVQLAQLAHLEEMQYPDHPPLNQQSLKK